MLSRYLLLTLAACAVDEPSQSTVAENLEGFNGENLNGENLNGENLNGENLNGENLNGSNTGTFTLWTSLENVRLDGVVVDGMTLAGTIFSGTREGVAITREDFVGAELQAMRGNGTLVALRITSAAQTTAGFWTYGVEYLETDGDWYSICHDSTGPLAALPLEGVWNHDFGQPGGGSHSSHPTRFTFACTKVGTLAKCVDNGYLPWSSPLLARHHQACVRMLRADYCGDGRSYTTNGRLVNLYDGIGIQSDTNDFRVEAEWDDAGARCLTDARRASPNADIPCYDPARVEGCGDVSHFDTGTLIINEIP